MGCGQGNILPSLLQELFYKYWEKHEKIVTYLFIDYLFALAHEKIPAVAAMVNRLPVEHFSNLSKCMNLEYSNEIAKEFCECYGFHKLTYKKAFEKQTVTGKETVYAHLMNYRNLLSET